MAAVKTFGERIADALVEDGLLTLKQVEDLLAQQKKEGTRLLKLILQKSYVSEQDMAVSMGRVLNTPPINLGRVTIQPEVGLVHLSPEAFHQGRVVARIINHGSEPYERLGLPPNSVTYWWAEYYQETHRGRSVLIATDAADGRILRRLEGDLTVEPDSMRQRYQLAVARWHWTTSGERPCFPCPWGWCGFVLKF